MHQEVESTRLNRGSLPSPGTDPSGHFCPPTGALLSSEGSKLQNLKLGLPQTSSMDVQFSERKFTGVTRRKRGALKGSSRISSFQCLEVVTEAWRKLI